MIHYRYNEAKENKMFSPQLTALIRFVRCDHVMLCAHCGRKIRSGDAAWTCLTDFKVAIEKLLTLEPSATILKALSPVCGKHCFSPAIPAAAIGCFDLSTKKAVPDDCKVLPRTGKALGRSAKKTGGK